jgi:hypothetical protein
VLTPQDIRYLTPKVVEVVKEDEERALFDSMTVERKR